MNPTTPKMTPKDFFVQVGVMLTLYISIIGIINLCFDAINHFYPDAISYALGTASIRWSVSLLIVLIPLTFYLEWIIRKDAAKDPSRNEISIQKWRVYLTLFLTGATIVVDLIVLINTFLGGEITTRFVLKALVILAVSGIIFTQYILEKGAKESTLALRKTLRIVIAILALAAIILGLFAVGSPYTQREIQFDSQRISDLSTLQSGITQYWQQNEVLPANLLKPLISFSSVPQDPETKAAYEYTVKGPLSYELCATFGLSSAVDQSQGSYPDYYGSQSNSWTHSAGHACFEETIDPSITPPYNRPIVSPMQAQ